MLKWLWLGAAVAMLDQLTKAVVMRLLELGDLVPVLPFLSWVRWHNEGAAFSMLSDAAGWQRWFFIVLAVGFVAFIIYELRRLPEDHKLMGWVYGLIAGGAVGNLIDRVAHGHVVDFVLLHYQQYYFPAFNIADMALTFGATLWIIAMVREHLRERKQQASS
ncbi:MAG: signal peptidase II [Pseudomonadales bacterium]